jgi:hypothetical protein
MPVEVKKPHSNGKIKHENGQNKKQSIIKFGSAIVKKYRRAS